ncbi:MAG: S1C family serine protease [Pirellulales bacterium]
MSRRPSALLVRCVSPWFAVLMLAIVCPALVLGDVAPMQVPAPKDAAELSAIEAKVKQVVAKVLPSVVGVRVGNSQGSGVIVSEDGYVMTAGHVVGKPGQDVTFFFFDGKTAKGKTLGMFGTLDAGLLKITEEGKKWPFCEKGVSKDVKTGAWCVAVGHPLGYQEGRPPVVRVGRVLRVDEDVLQTDCPLVGGDSGGPLFDLDGKVVGINNRIGGPTDMNFHVPVDVFRANWDRLVKGDSWQLSLPGRDSADVKAPFRPLVAEASRCVVRILCNGQEVALGTIVGPDGWIVTKASELRGKIVCRLRDGRELVAGVAGINDVFDLAMLKVNASSLPVIPWTAAQPGVGQWVAAPGPSDEPLAVGVISVPRRPIPAISGMLGIVLKAVDGPAEIEQVLPKSPAETAGLKAKDIITQVDGKAVANRTELVNELRKHRAGVTVTLAVKRGEQTLTIMATLANLETPETLQRNMQNSMGVGVSKRRDAFPVVLQHDTVIRPVDCGGPMVDLTGKVIGVNVAHAGRTETYCVPGDVLVMLMYDLMSGRLNPVLLAETRVTAAKAATEKARAEQKTADESAAAAKAAATKATEEAKAAEAAAAASKTAAEKASADQKAAEDQVAPTKAAADKAAGEAKAAEDRAVPLRAAADKAAAEGKDAEQQAAAAKANSEKVAAEAKNILDQATAARAAVGAAPADQKPAAEQAAKAAEDKAAAAKAAADQAAAAQKAADDRVAAAKATIDKSAAERKASEDAVAATKAATDKAAADFKAATDRVPAAKALAEKAAADRKPVDEKAAAAKTAAEKALAQQKSADERAALAKSLVDKAASEEKMAESRVASAKAAAEKAAADQKAPEKPAAKP